MPIYRVTLKRTVEAYITVNIEAPNQPTATMVAQAAAEADQLGAPATAADWDENPAWFQIAQGHGRVFGNPDPDACHEDFPSIAVYRDGEHYPLPAEITTSDAATSRGGRTPHA